MGGTSLSAARRPYSRGSAKTRYCADGFAKLQLVPQLMQPKSKVTVSRNDSADYLKTEQDMAAYLEACLEAAPDDASHLAAALGTIARARGMVQLSRDTGISRDGLYKALSKDGNPTFDTVLKVMRALGLRFDAKAA